MGIVAICSFRLGTADGVSIVAGHWATALGILGWDVVTVAGEGPVDRTVAGLGLDGDAVDRRELDDSLADADVVVVENLATIPLNLPAARAVAGVLSGRPAVLHHHDPPWQRARFAEVTELPPDDPAWRHVAINQRTRLELADRGIDAVTVWNAFDVHGPPGDRRASRSALGVSDGVRLVAHPVRAIARKDVPASVRLCEALDATYWLLGEAEEDYADTLVDVLASARCPVIHRPSPGSLADAYAACDLVTFTSTWEGFGNPPVEAAIHRRPAVVGDYPVAHELREFGFEWFSPRDVTAVDAFLRSPDRDLLERNRAIAVEHFSIERLVRDLDRLFSAAGWRP
jgi:mannosylglucosylglycerate synthase